MKSFIFFMIEKNEKTAGSADGLLTIVSFFYLTIAKKD